MQCPECAGDVPVLREFCPHCGAPTDPGLRARQREPRGERSDDHLRGNRKKVLIGGAAILAVLAVMGKISLPGPDIRIDTGHDDDRKGPVVIQAQELVDAYREDEHAADRRFDDREMVVSGEFLRIVPDGYGSLDLRLKTSDPDRPLGVDVAGIAIDDAKKLHARPASDRQLPGHGRRRRYRLGARMRGPVRRRRRTGRPQAARPASAAACAARTGRIKRRLNAGDPACCFQFMDRIRTTVRYISELTGVFRVR